MTCRSLLRHCKTGLDIWVFREMGYTHVYLPHCQCNRENDAKLLGLGVVYVQTNPLQWKNACNPLPPCPSVDGHQPCSPTCLRKNLGRWNITNGFIFPAWSVQEISKPHHLHHHGVWKKTHQHHPFEMNPQHEIEWNPNLKLDVLSQVTWDTWHCPLTNGKYKTGDMIASDLESKKVLKLSWCFCFKLVIASLHMFYSYCPDWWFHHVSLPLKSMLVIRDHHPSHMVWNELRLKPTTTLLILGLYPL